MVGIIDYGVGNLGSIKNMLKVLGEKSVISSDVNVLNECDHLILPGVGSFDAGISNIDERGLREFVVKKANEGTPILGICLGMQLLGRKSEEGILPGLGLIPFDNVRFKFDNNELKIPHMGWDIVDIKQDIGLTKDLKAEQQRYYFVHSYHALCDKKENILMTCDYGYDFAAAVVNKNVYGVQFHPEKSLDFGMTLLKNFVREC